jgi:hypothetical protein
MIFRAIHGCIDNYLPLKNFLKFIVMLFTVFGCSETTFFLFTEEKIVGKAWENFSFGFWLGENKRLIFLA